MFGVDGCSLDADAHVLVGEPHLPLTDACLRAAAEHADLVVGIAYDFDPTPTPSRCWRVVPHRDLAISDLGYEPGACSFTRQPDCHLTVHPVRWGVELEIGGIDPRRVHSLLVDDDHDGVTFATRRLHLLGDHADRDLTQLARRLKVDRRDPAAVRRLDSVRTLRTSPMTPPASGTVGVRVVTTLGLEITRYARVPTC